MAILQKQQPVLILKPTMTGLPKPKPFLWRTAELWVLDYIQNLNYRWFPCDEGYIKVYYLEIGIVQFEDYYNPNQLEPVIIFTSAIKHIQVKDILYRTEFEKFNLNGWNIRLMEEIIHKVIYRLEGLDLKQFDTVG